MKMSKLFALTALSVAVGAGCAPAGSVNGGYTGPTVTPESASTAVQSSSKSNATPRVLVSITNGSGKKNTGVFIAPEHWQVSYTYKCTSEYANSFYLNLYKLDTPDYPTDNLVSDFDKKSSQGVTDVYFSGPLHLEVDTDCTYSLKAVTVG